MGDTVGAYDAQDQHHNNNMAMYFRSCGGINMFCIFFKFGGKADANYKALLRSYREFWGAGIRKHCVVIITQCDQSEVEKGKKYEKGLKLTKKTLRADLKDIFGDECESIDIFEFGDGNFVEARKKLMLLLDDDSKPFEDKYSCDKIRSPIDELWDKLEPMIKKQRELALHVMNLYKELK